MLEPLKIFKMKPEVKGIHWGSDRAACFDISAFITYQSSVKAFTKSNQSLEILAASDEKGAFVEIPSEWRLMIPTGMIFDIPEHHYMRIYPRSGLSTKQGLNLINCVGIIDEDYVEQLFIPLYNNSQEKIKIYNGDRIAQGELVRTERPTFVSYINERPSRKGDRDGGFGSSGI